MNSMNPNINFAEIVKHEWTSEMTIDAWRRWSEKLSIHTYPLTQAVVQHARLEPGMSVLDLACGTGEPSITIAKAVQANGSVVATDLSEGMLKVAEENADNAGIKNISFQIADAHELPFADNSFDRVVSRLGLMYFWDVATALKEIRRVLKPNGLVSFVVWGPTEKNEFLASLLLPFMKKKEMPVPPVDAPTPMRFGDIGKLTKVFKKASFSNIDAKEYIQELPWPGNPMELFNHVYDVAVPLQPYFDSFQNPEREEALQEINDVLGKYWDGSHTRARGAFNAITATK